MSYGNDVEARPRHPGGGQVVNRRRHRVEYRARRRRSWALLAGLRFVLAFIVVCGHLTSNFVYKSWASFGLWLNQEGSVYGFFLVSGYSIASSLERAPTHYFQRRLERIWPLYLAALSFTAIVVCVTHSLVVTPRGHAYLGPTFPEFLGSLLMAQTFIVPAVSYIAPSWSLSIEWWLYMIAPLFKRMPTFILAILISASIWRFIVHPDLDFADRPYLGYAWLWIVGFIYARHRDHKWSALLLTVPCMVVWQFGGTLYLATIATIIALTICRDVKIPSAQVRKALNWAGDLSYPLYLIHVPTMILLCYLHMINPILLVLGCCAAAAALLYGVDYPIRRQNAAAVRKAAVSASILFVAVAGLLISFSATSTSAASAAFARPAPKFMHRVRIMPMGDSITYGSQEKCLPEQIFAFPPGGYRPTLYQMLKSEGLYFRFVGSVRAGAGAYDWDCEARPGVTSRGMAEAFPRWDYDHPADIYLLMLGTNDCGYSIPLQQSMHWQRLLWSEIFARNPRALVLAASLTPIHESSKTALTNNWVAAYDAELKRQAGLYAAQNHKRLVFVDLNAQAGIQQNDFQPSGIHPNSVGYRKMAIFWANTLKRYIRPPQ